MTASLKIKSQQVFHSKNADVSAPRPAAVLLVQTRDGRFLSLKRARGSELKHWGILGGMVDAGETPLQAVLREAREEGCFIPKRKPEFLDTYTAYSEKYGKTPVHIFRTMIDHPCHIRMNVEHSALGWFHLKDWPAPKTELMQFIMNKYGRNLAHQNPTPYSLGK